MRRARQRTESRANSRCLLPHRVQQLASRSALGQYYGGGRADLGKIRGVGGEARPRCDRRQRGEVVVLVGDKGRRGEVVVGKRVGGARLWWG